MRSCEAGVPLRFGFGAPTNMPVVCKRGMKRSLGGNAKKKPGSFVAAGLSREWVLLEAYSPPVLPSRSRCCRALRIALISFLEISPFLSLSTLSKCLTNFLRPAASASLREIAPFLSVSIFLNLSPGFGRLLSDRSAWLSPRLPGPVFASPFWLRRLSAWARSSLLLNSPSALRSISSNFLAIGPLASLLERVPLVFVSRRSKIFLSSGRLPSPGLPVASSCAI